VKSILLTNDDGIEAEGLKFLRSELRHIAHVLVVAPNHERSAVSHGLEIRSRLKLEEAGTDNFALSGTPVNCVIYALDKLFVSPPDIVISGINHGANLGDNIMYSGTVAAAREAARYGIPAIAVSQDFEDGKKIRFKEGSEFVRDMVKNMLHKGLYGELLLNVNIPAGKIKGIKITRQGCSVHPAHFNVPFNVRNDENDSSFNSLNNDFTSDRLAVFEGYVSVTPLQRDQTDYVAARALKEAAGQLFGKR
jgi:5'-nucleotidase